MEKFKFSFGAKKEEQKTKSKELEKTKSFGSQEIARDLVGLHNAPPPENTSYETLKKAYENAKVRGRMLDAAYWEKKMKDSKKSGSDQSVQLKASQNETITEEQKNKPEKTSEPLPVSNAGELEILPSSESQEQDMISEGGPVASENIPISIIPERQEKKEIEIELKPDKINADIPKRISEINFKINELKSEMEKSKELEYREKREVGVMEQTKIEERYEAARKKLEDEVGALEKEKKNLEKEAEKLARGPGFFERTNKKLETIKTGLRNRLDAWRKEKDTEELISAEENVLGAIVYYNELLEKYSKKWGEDPEAVASMRYEGKLERILIAFNL